MILSLYPLKTSLTRLLVTYLRGAPNKELRFFKMKTANANVFRNLFKQPLCLR